MVSDALACLFSIESTNDWLSVQITASDDLLLFNIQFRIENIFKENIVLACNYQTHFEVLSYLKLFIRGKWVIKFLLYAVAVCRCKCTLIYVF